MFDKINKCEQGGGAKTHKSISKAANLLGSWEYTDVDAYVHM